MIRHRWAYRLGWRSLRYVSPNLSRTQAKQLAHDLGQAMHDHDIETRTRAAMFVAQVCHESGGFRWREELATGYAYEGRSDLGNTHAGDGRRYKGRGFIQVTGRANFVEISRALRQDFVGHPELLSQGKWASVGAAWWWRAHGLNGLADTGNFVAVTRRINGGTNGLADRQAYYARARRVARWLVPKRRRP